MSLQVLTTGDSAGAAVFVGPPPGAIYRQDFMFMAFAGFVIEGYQKGRMLDGRPKISASQVDALLEACWPTWQETWGSLRAKGAAPGPIQRPGSRRNDASPALEVVGLKLFERITAEVEKLP